MIKKIRTQFASRLHEQSAQRVLHVLYLCALIFYVVWFGLSVTNAGKAPTLQMPVSFFSAAVKGYLGFFLFCIFLLDAFYSGISKRKFVFGVAAVVLLQNVILNIAASDTQKCALQFFVWIILSYPRYLESRRALNAIWISGAGFVGIIAALSIAGVVPNADVSQSRAIVANSFGFRNLSAESLLLSSLIMIWVYCKSQSWSWIKSAIAIALIGAVFLVTGSRVNMMLGILQVVFTCLLSQGAKWAWVRKKLPRILGKLGIAVLPALALLSLLLVILGSYNTGILKAVNSIMGGGIELGSKFFTGYGYPLFCERIENINRLDNTFISVVMSCGAICLVCMIVLYWRFARYAERKHNTYMLLLVTLLAVRMLFDPIMFLPVYNPVLVAIGAFIAIGPGWSDSIEGSQKLESF